MSVAQSDTKAVSTGYNGTQVGRLEDIRSKERSVEQAGALQSGTRTLLAEIDIPNPDGALPPVVYCTVELKIPRKSPSLMVPADALIFDRDGLQVAVVKDGKSEIKPGDRVVLNPPVNLVEGSKVQLAAQ